MLNCNISTLYYYVTTISHHDLSIRDCQTQVLMHQLKKLKQTLRFSFFLAIYGLYSIIG